MTNWINLIPFFVAVIGVFGTISPLLINKFIETDKKPFFKMDIIPNLHKDGRSQVKLINTGDSTATNVSLLLDAHKKNISIVDLFSPLKINPPNINQSLLKIQIPKFGHGSGSILSFDILTNDNKNTSFYNYTAFLTYDQGSNSFEFSSKNSSYVPPSSEEQLNEFYKSIGGSPIILSFWGLLSIVFSLIIALIWNNKKNKTIKKSYLRKIIDNVLMVRSNLKYNIYYQSPLSSINHDDLSYLFSEIRSIVNIKDFIVIDDFYIQLTTRNNIVLNNPINKDKIRKANETCFNYAENTLKSIDWQTYLD